MSRVHCTNCGRDGHAKWQCTRPTKSTAARKDVRQRTEAMMEDAPHLSASKLNSDPTLTRATAIAGTQALPVDTNNPSSPKGSGVESLRTPTEGRKGRDSTSGGARAKLRDPSAVLTQTAAQPPVGTRKPESHEEPSEMSGTVAGQETVANNLGDVAQRIEQGNSSAQVEGSNPSVIAKFDKVAYMAKYMARYRSEIKSGKRVPKKKGETT